MSLTNRRRWRCTERTYMSCRNWCNSWEIMPVNRKHQIFILLCLHFTSVQSDFERVCNSQTDLRGPDPQGICGRLIPEMLHLVCGGQYYVPSKRDVSSLSHHKQDRNVDFPRYSPLEGLILGKREASMYLTSQHSRTKRNAYQGIVCECCYHGCNWFELQQYCGFRKKRNTEPDSIPASSQNSGKLIDSVLNKWYKNIRILFWRWIYFYNRAFYEKKAENLVLLCLFLFSRVNRFFTSQILFLFRCTCGRDCAVNGGRVICSGDGYSSS